MASMIVGNFEIEVGEPYPAWVRIRHSGNEMRLHHKELSDLKYVVEKAMKEARLKLKLDKDEV